MPPKPPRLVEGVDYYLEGQSLVFTAHYLLRRGYCCNSGCRHCPYKKGAAPPVRVQILGGDALGEKTAEKPAGGREPGGSNE